MLTERQQEILMAVVSTYVKTAEPVSSKLLHEKYFSNLSPATLRNEMLELERLYYLAQPHTSSGRIPTDKAYRFYVDYVVNKDNVEIPQNIKNRVDERIDRSSNDPRELNKSLAQLVSDLSEGIVVANISQSDDFFKYGLSGMSDVPEFREVGRLVELVQMFDQFEQIFDRVERSMLGQMGNEIRIMIGKENPLRNNSDETMIVAKYRLPGRVTGSLTLIGPIRMNYSKNIGLMKYIVNELNNRNN